VLDDRGARPDEAVEQRGLAHVGAPHDDHERCVGHGRPSGSCPGSKYPRRVSASGSRVQFLATATVSRSSHGRPVSSEIRARASELTALIIAPPLPMTMPFWLSRSTKILPRTTSRSGLSAYEATLTAHEDGRSSPGLATSAPR